MPARRLRLVLVTALTAALAAVAPAAAEAPKLGFYGCVHYDPQQNNLVHKYNVVLARRGSYTFAVFAIGKRLRDPRRGTYTLKGSRVDFRTGPMKSRYALVKRGDHGQFLAIYAKATRHFTAVSCNRQ